MRIILCFLIFSLICLAKPKPRSDPRISALINVEKELLFLTESLKSNKKNKTIRATLKHLVLLEQYIIHHGLSEYALDLISKYDNDFHFKKQILDCLIWKAIDFDITYNINPRTWERVQQYHPHTTEILMDMKNYLAKKVHTCLAKITYKWTWIGGPYIYGKYEKSAKKIAINGLELMKLIEKQAKEPKESIPAKTQ